MGGGIEKKRSLEGVQEVRGFKKELGAGEVRVEVGRLVGVRYSFFFGGGILVFWYRGRYERGGD